MPQSTERVSRKKTTGAKAKNRTGASMLRLLPNWGYRKGKVSSVLAPQQNHAGRARRGYIPVACKINGLAQESIDCSGPKDIRFPLALPISQAARESKHPTYRLRFAYRGPCPQE
jgi:hypothetical protein